jgi:hypothetical protein
MISSPAVRVFIYLAEISQPIKVKSAPVLNYAMKTYGTALVGEWSASRLGRFAPGERASSTHWIGG